MGFTMKLSLAFAILMVTSEMSDAARILGLFPMPSRSHFAIAEALMKGLAARGHQVDVVSAFPLKNPPTNYRDISIADHVPMSVNNLTFGDTEEFSVINFRYIVKMAGTSLCDVIDLPDLRNIIENPPTDPPYDLVIHEFFASECFLAFGRHLKVPVVALIAGRLYDWINPIMGNPSSVGTVPSLFTDYDQNMGYIKRMMNVFHNVYVTRFYWYGVSSQLAIVEKHFGMGLKSTSELFEDVAIVLVNSHPSFDYIRPINPNIVEIGGLHVADSDDDLSPEVKKWLDESDKGCVYFSFGSMFKIETFPNKTIQTFYAAFERIAPVRVLLKITNATQLLPGLPKNVMTSTWLPQTKVLQHKNVKAFATHCGIMSAQEAVTYGVPMIAIPIYSDQYLNARLCENHGVGVTVDHHTATPDSLAKDINTVVLNSSYSENAKRLAKLFADRPMSALDTATFWVEHVLRNGNVMRSPAAGMFWWEWESFDVYVSLMVIQTIVSYLLYQLLKDRDILQTLFPFWNVNLRAH